MMKLAVVIVSYNVRYHLAQCLMSVERAIEGMAAEIWVVDNASTDGSVEYLQSLFPRVHFIANKENVGFSRANNMAIRESQSEYVLILNPDTIVGEDVLKGCVAFLDAHTEVGATGVRMLNPDGSFARESRRGLPTPFTSFAKMSGLATLFPKSRLFGRYYMRYLDADKPCEIEVISGAFNMMRRQAIREVGMLDEDFFMYGEDIDLSYRILKGGWKNYYLPLNIIHYKGESTQKNSYRYTHNFYNAMLIFYNKHYGSRLNPFSLLVRLAVFVRALMDLVVRQFGRPISWFCSAPKLDYVRHDIRAVSISETLEALRCQPQGRRCHLETISTDGTMLIHHSEVIPNSSSLRPLPRPLS